MKMNTDTDRWKVKNLNPMKIDFEQRVPVQLSPAMRRARTRAKIKRALLWVLTIAMVIVILVGLLLAWQRFH